MSLLTISLFAFIITLLGGLVALTLKDRLHLVLGFSAGAIIGVTFFELIPEAFSLTNTNYSTETVSTIIALGFAFYLIFDRIILQHSHIQCRDEHEHEPITNRGYLAASSLALHSFLDGIAIGLAFQVSSGVGLTVAIAVLMHDFSDGINIVGMIVRYHGRRVQALRWLTLNSLAPALGVISTLFFTVSESVLGLLLALFAGFFLYIGATDLIPESHHEHPKKLTTLMTLSGLAVMYVSIALISL